MKWRVLLLDCALQPVQVITWTRAMKLLLKGKAEIVEEYDWQTFTERKNFNIPCVIRLLKRLVKREAVKFNRHNVYLRDGHKCQYCGRCCQAEDLTFDHVMPRSRGNSPTTWENIVTACFRCNVKKANRTPEEAGMKLLRKPKKPDWDIRMILRLTNNDPKVWMDYLYWNVELTT